MLPESCQRILEDQERLIESPSIFYCPLDRLFSADRIGNFRFDEPITANPRVPALQYGEISNLYVDIFEGTLEKLRRDFLGECAMQVSQNYITFDGAPVQLGSYEPIPEGDRSANLGVDNRNRFYNSTIKLHKKR